MFHKNDNGKHNTREYAGRKEEIKKREKRGHGKEETEKNPTKDKINKKTKQWQGF